MIRILIESDLLLASLKKEDRLKPAATRILKAIDSGKLEGVYASVAAIQEVIFWFYNRNLKKQMVQAVNALAHMQNIDWVEITPEICLTASVLMDEQNMSPFDAYHAATAMLRDRIILSTEHIYDEIKTIRKVDLETLAEGLVT